MLLCPILDLVVLPPPSRVEMVDEAPLRFGWDGLWVSEICVMHCSVMFLDKAYADRLLPVACEPRALRWCCLGSADDEFIR